MATSDHTSLQTSVSVAVCWTQGRVGMVVKVRELSGHVSNMEQTEGVFVDALC